MENLFSLTTLPGDPTELPLDCQPLMHDWSGWPELIAALRSTPPDAPFPWSAAWAEPMLEWWPQVAFWSSLLTPLNTRPVLQAYVALLMALDDLNPLLRGRTALSSGAGPDASDDTPESEQSARLERISQGLVFMRRRHLLTTARQVIVWTERAARALSVVEADDPEEAEEPQASRPTNPQEPGTGPHPQQTGAGKPGTGPHDPWVSLEWSLTSLTDLLDDYPLVWPAAVQQHPEQYVTDALDALLAEGHRRLAGHASTPWTTHDQERWANFVQGYQQGWEFHAGKERLARLAYERVVRLTFDADPTLWADVTLFRAYVDAWYDLHLAWSLEPAPPPPGLPF